MAQENLNRSHFKKNVAITIGRNSVIQFVENTDHFEKGDLIDIVDLDDSGNFLSALNDNITIIEISDELNFLVLSTAVDTTSTPVGSFYVVSQEIDDGFSAIDRLYIKEPRKNGFDPHCGYNLIDEGQKIHVETNKQSFSNRVFKQGGYLKHSGFIKRG